MPIPKLNYFYVTPLQSELPKPSRVLHTSRFLMKGYKFQRFVLDLQLLPWYILIWISFGIASISIFPYIYSSQIFFYQRLLEIKRRNVLTAVIKNQHLHRKCWCFYFNKRILKRVMIAGPPCFIMIFFICC